MHNPSFALHARHTTHNTNNGVCLWNCDALLTNEFIQTHLTVSHYLYLHELSPHLHYAGNKNYTTKPDNGVPKCDSQDTCLSIYLCCWQTGKAAGMKTEKGCFEVFLASVAYSSADVTVWHYNYLDGSLSEIKHTGLVTFREEYAAEAREPSKQDRSCFCTENPINKHGQGGGSIK